MQLNQPRADDARGGPEQGGIACSKVLVVAKQDVKASAALSQSLKAAIAECKSTTSKRKADADGRDLDPSSRSRLHDACEQILNRRLEPGDVLYRFREEQGGQVAELSLPSLPGPCGQQTWVSGVRDNRRAARVHVADLALRSLKADSELAALIAELTNGRQPSRPSSPSAERSSSSSSDAKGELVVFCQWSCGRPMGKRDIVYTVARRDGEFIATARLNCFGGHDFVGEPRVDRRQAEQAAAAEALRAHQKDLAVMARAAPKRRRVQGEAAPRDADPGAKQRLHEACVKILGREPQAGDVVYEVVLADDGPAASLRIPCLPGELGSRVWASGPCASRSDARAKAAGAALESMLKDSSCESGLLA